MKNTAISVIIPCFNQQKHIKECLDSIINQKFDSYEIIAVDDGSSDSTPEILRAYASKNKKINEIEIENSEDITKEEDSQYVEIKSEINL